ncbi:pyridoxamine 5'-phosphate oxidase family protein [Maribius pontilimi]|uniref:Pyridoxamine 5'-phosphate oxidase family protein n=1 Tax=Palleronia pontilimi TaxID=1964209 RepID=A0A934IHG6_9RHOB|nr:pyridoxamine 5'-phosphate oxidase family protein [Palleronia pontilimi]MBJ3763450.1 pyridoxamine 5'-phosphate oxidase family protein [Palleronia pontilimi]
MTAMDDWANDLTKLWDFCWQKLGRGAADAKSPLHRPVLATVGLGGGAEARTLVLRGASPSARTLELHTDTASTKVSELRATPLASLLFWDPKSDLQLRARVHVQIDEDTDGLWSRLSDGARSNYGGTPPTGAPILSPDAYDKTPQPDRLTRLVCHLQSLDVVHLGPEHRRALYARDADFTGQWLAP